MLQYRLFKTAWGHFAIVAAGEPLRASFLPDTDKGRLERLVRRRYPDARPNAELLPDLVRRIQAHFEGEPVVFDVPLDLDGVTEFRRRVLEACRRIPRGKTASYADLARAAGSPNAVRAAGSTMAHNPLPLIVPCHRVVRSDGSLGKFSSPQGPNQKRRLLELEGALSPKRK